MQKNHENSIMETVTRIEKRQKEALEIFEKYDGCMNKNQLAEKLKCSAVTAARLLKTLANNGYLKQNENVKPYSYKLSNEENSLKPFVLSENLSEYKAKYLNELKAFLTRSSYLVTSAIAKTFSVEIPEELEQKYFISSMTSEKVPTEPSSELFTEAKAKQLVFSEKIDAREISNCNVIEPLTPDFEDAVEPTNSEEAS